MSKHIIINAGKTVTKTALLENGRLVEVVVDDANDESLVGNIYAGLVKTILPARFAFVDIGLAKNAFVHLTDAKEANLYKNGKLTLKQGQTMLVQVVKDPVGTKGAYVTGRLSFTGRYLVAAKAAGGPAVGISKKIEDTEERERLKAVFANADTGELEIIVRTNAAGVSEGVLLAELDKLAALYNKTAQWQNTLPPALLHKEAGSLKKAVSDLYSADVTDITVNCGKTYGQLLDCLADIPNAPAAVKLYSGEIPIFEMFPETCSIKTQLEKAAQKRVWLKCGGFIIIEHTEACVVIDVNTGKFSGSKSHEETVLRVNLEAAAAIAEQLRLRNLGGIIIIDFIDMKQPQNIKLLTDRLIEETKKDRLAVSVVGMTELGLMQLTRKKARKPL